MPHTKNQNVEMYVRGALTRAELKQFMVSLGETVRKLQESLREEVNSDKKEVREEVEKSKSEMNKIVNDALSKIDKTEKRINTKSKDLNDSVKEDVRQAKVEIQKLKADVFQDFDKRIKDLDNSVKKLKIPKAEEIQKQIEQNLPQFGTAFRDGLELLQDEERLDKSAIKGLDEMFKELTERIQKASAGGKGIMNPIGDRVLVDDLSTQTDGSTFTFDLQKAPRDPVKKFILMGSDFPTILRPSVDFTVANKQLTLDSNQVDAPSNGATLIAQYAI